MARRTTNAVRTRAASTRWFDVGSEVALAFDGHRHEGIGHDVLTAVRKRRSRPRLPLRNARGDDQRALRDPDDPGTEPVVDADPGVEGKAIGARPPCVVARSYDDSRSPTVTDAAT
jgi:hypothetical protein